MIIVKLFEQCLIWFVYSYFPFFSLILMNLINCDYQLGKSVSQFNWKRSRGLRNLVNLGNPGWSKDFFCLMECMGILGLLLDFLIVFNFIFIFLVYPQLCDLWIHDNCFWHYLSQLKSLKRFSYLPCMMWVFLLVGGWVGQKGFTLSVETHFILPSPDFDCHTFTLKWVSMCGLKSETWNSPYHVWMPSRP